MQDVARFYGLEMNRTGMACCPFHEDKTPSLKVYDENYYCFGCTSSGDATDFVARLYNISQFEAAKKISSDFGLNLTKQEFVTPVKSVLDERQQYLHWVRKATEIVSKYHKLLQGWRVEYAPVTQTDMPHPKFVESLQNMSHIEYLRDTLSFGSDKDKKELHEHNRLDIQKIEGQLQKVALEKRIPKRKAI